jgi:Holliday junction DNA helicase RuvB
MNDLRPTSLTNIIGQERILRCLKISINAAKTENKPLSHILLSGPPGLGKTSIALAVANELNRPIQIANGATCRSIPSILPYLTRTSFGSVLFIDEIHRLTSIVEETLYPVLEDFRLILRGDSKETTINLDKFTVIGATTDTGKISKPLYDRFVIQHTLDEYTDSNLTTLVQQSAKTLGLSVDINCATEIAKRSKGVPRLANNYLLWIKDYALSHGVITTQLINDAFKLLLVNSQGLTQQDRLYLLVLKNFNIPTGLSTLSSSLNIDEETIETQIEPFLLRKRMIAKTSKGRICLK